MFAIAVCDHSSSVHVARELGHDGRAVMPTELRELWDAFTHDDGGMFKRLAYLPVVSTVSATLATVCVEVCGVVLQLRTFGGAVHFDQLSLTKSDSIC